MSGATTWDEWLAIYDKGKSETCNILRSMEAELFDALNASNDYKDKWLARCNAHTITRQRLAELEARCAVLEGALRTVQVMLPNPVEDSLWTQELAEAITTIVQTALTPQRPPA